MRFRILLMAASVGLALGGLRPAAAADRFYAFNLTTSTDFDGLYMAPAGTTNWGPNQVLNDKDKSLDHSERLRLTGIGHGRYDVKLTYGNAHVCIRPGIDLTRDPTFDIRDADLAKCH